MSRERPKIRQPICTVCLLTALIMWLPILSAGFFAPPRTVAAAEHGILKQSLLPAAGKGSLYFEPNAGQTSPAVRFLARAKGAILFFTPSEVDLTIVSGTAGRKSKAEELRTEGVVRLRFLGANQSPRVEAGETLAGKVNYLLGNDPSRWHTNLPTYAGITYRDLYPGITLAYSGVSGALKGTYTVAPGVDPSRIRWRYDDTHIWVDKQGNLQVERTEMKAHSGDFTAARLCLPVTTFRMTESAPVAWQQKQGRRVPVAVRYAAASGGSVGFEVGTYDHTLPLVIDPTLGYSTYLGGTGNDSGSGIAVVNGSAYVSGLTTSVDFPLANPRQPNHRGGGTDVFVTRLNASGTQLLYSTYLGGNGGDDSWGMTVDSDGNAYVTGYTNSTDFPLVNPLQGANRGFRDAFLSKLSADGSSLLYSTYLGGSGWDEGWAVEVDRDGNAYVAGNTTSADFPTRNPIQGTNRGGQDAFVSKLNRDGTALVYSTYAGGAGNDGALGVRIDADRNAYITGGTTSPDYPTRTPFQGTNRGGQDAFVTKLNRDGTAWVYSTYVGGGGDDVSWAIAVSGAGAAYITGYAGSTDFPTRNPIQPANGGGADGFVTALAPSGSSLLYSTYLGGNGGYDAGYGIAVDDAGYAYAGGITSSTNFPIANPIQATNRGDDEAFVSKLIPAGSSLVYSTYLGGSGGDYSYGLAIDAAGSAYIAGQTDSSDFPTASAFQPARAGGHDAFITRIDAPAPPPPSPTPSACAITFSDVHESDFFYEAVRYLYCAGAISGYGDGTFRPYLDTTRGQLSKIIVLAQGWPIVTPPQPTFTDVPASHPFYGYIETAHSRGAIAGYANGTFQPANNVTRGQLSKIIVLAQGWPIDISGGPHFSDVPPRSTFYDYVETAYNHTVISGYGDGTFRPGNSATRGQICKIVHNALGAMKAGG